MKTLFKNGTVINVFTGELERKNVLIEDNIITGVGDYSDSDADTIIDVSEKYLCPGFIDSHIHIESTMLTPAELSKVIVPKGTTSIIADPHEIANVCGTDGISYMLKASENLPLKIYFMLPSCVPATLFDESGAVLTAKELKPFYSDKRVLGLAEVMNYPGVILGDDGIKEKINDCIKNGRRADGHAPMLSGKDLDKYIAAGISSDHECSSFDEALEKLNKGQWIMIRQGTAAKNLEDLKDLFDAPYSHRCLLVTDDRHPADLINEGHIDSIIRLAVKLNKSPITAIQMATIWPAQYFGLKNTGAIAPGYTSDILVLNNIENVEISDVYVNGVKVDTKNIKTPKIDAVLENRVRNTFNIKAVTPKDFYIEPKSKKCRVIKTVPDQLLTEELITDINWDKNNGIDKDRDIIKLAVMERHHNTGNVGLGFVSGIGLKKGAVAASVSHDAHNLIVIGANEKDMAVAANHIRECGGGYAIVCDGKVLADLPLPIAGLMSDESAKAVSDKNENIINAINTLGAGSGSSPLMVMAFVSLSVIPHLKMTTKGLVNVNLQKLESIYYEKAE